MDYYRGNLVKVVEFIGKIDRDTLKILKLKALGGPVY